MPFELIARNILVRGEFNRAIIQPRWLTQQGVTPDGNVEILMSDSPGMPRVFRFQEVKWEVGPDRLVLTPSDAKGRDPGPLVARILELLPHTPVTALGHNFLFESSETSLSITPCLGQRTAAALARQLGGELAQGGWSIVISTDAKTRITAKVLEEPDRQRIDLNFHHVVTDASEAKLAAGGSAECLTRAKELLATLLGES